MEDLLDYLLYALFEYEVTSVDKVGKIWTICLEGRVYFTLDENDLEVIRRLYEARLPRLDNEERARYIKIFDTCI